jgi:hypothetical protein
VDENELENELEILKKKKIVSEETAQIYLSEIQKKIQDKERLDHPQESDPGDPT